jgi:ADP-ribose pyrophosphatase
MATDSNRAFPPNPLVGVGVVVQRENTVLLVKRANEPKKGLWAIPGGLIKLGESVQQAAVREVFEECSISIQLQDVISVVDLIDKDDEGKIKYHFVLIDFVAQYTGGELRADSDALDAAWVPMSELDQFDIPEITRKVISKV